MHPANRLSQQASWITEKNRTRRKESDGKSQGGVESIVCYQCRGKQVTNSEGSIKYLERKYHNIPFQRWSSETARARINIQPRRTRTGRQGREPHERKVQAKLQKKSKLRGTTPTMPVQAQEEDTGLGLSSQTGKKKARQYELGGRRALSSPESIFSLIGSKSRQKKNKKPEKP